MKAIFRNWAFKYTSMKAEIHMETLKSLIYKSSLRIVTYYRSGQVE